MLVLLLSPAAMVGDQPVVGRLARVLTEISETGVAVLFVSNHPKPEWFDARFRKTEVEFLQAHGRQNGDVVRTIAEHVKVPTHDILVLASSNDDLRMGKNGGAIVLSAQWGVEDDVRHLGIEVASPDELEQVVALTRQWSGEWWYEGQGVRYKVRALSDLSSIHKSITQREFSERVTSTVKHGGAHLSALLTVTARSLLKEGVAANSLFGVYPSSTSENDDNEVLSDFTHRLRTTVARTHFAERGKPLFIRHKPSIRRHSAQAADRENPKNQVETMYLNPFYKSRLGGRHVVVVDDCTTYGVSFGVASSFLLKGGAASVTGIALGKFGSPIKEYAIAIKSGPFSPTSLKTFTKQPFEEKSNLAAQGLLRTLLRP